MAKRSVWKNLPLVVVRDGWPHSSGGSDIESIRSKIIVAWERWQDASLPLSSPSFFGPTARYHPPVGLNENTLAAANWHHLRMIIVALFRHECWNGITSTPPTETMARLIDEAASEPIFPAQHTAKQLEAARKKTAGRVQTAVAMFLASLPDVLEAKVTGKSALDAKRLAFNDAVRLSHGHTNPDQVAAHWNEEHGETISGVAMNQSCKRARNALKQG